MRRGEACDMGAHGRGILEWSIAHIGPALAAGVAFCRAPQILSMADMERFQINRLALVRNTRRQGTRRGIHQRAKRGIGGGVPGDAFGQVFHIAT